MKGLWKEKLSGWNQKGERRKRQNRKHSLKDNFDYIEKAAYRDIDNKNYKWEGSYEPLIEEVVKYGYQVDVYIAEVSSFWHSKDFVYEKNKKVCKEVGKSFYKDYETKENLRQLSVKVKKELGREFIKYDEPITFLIKEVLHNPGKLFVYGKPVDKKKWYRGTRRRKWTQRFLNKDMRSKVRKYIHNENWDDVIDSIAEKNTVNWLVI